jgi:Domain of unknown function (DUF4157)
MKTAVEPSQAAAQAAAQRRSRSQDGGDWSASLGQSPRQALQRQQVQALQRAGVEEELPAQGKALQRAGVDEELPAQGKALQRAGGEEELPAQGKADPLQREAQPAAAATAAPAAANGLPGPLRQGVEALSGMDLSDVRVHRNSDRPATVQALAYAQGNDVHLGPGQEQHLPHEAWHVVQQRQGRVQPTFQMQGMAVNDDASLEAEADHMGAKALGMGSEKL